MGTTGLESEYQNARSDDEWRIGPLLGWLWAGPVKIYVYIIVVISAEVGMLPRV